MSDDEWQTVRRRRRNTPADTQRKLGALGIPVVPLSIMKLDNELTMEERQEAEKRKKRNEAKKRRKAEQKAVQKQTDLAPEPGPEPVNATRGSSTSKAKPGSTAAVVKPPSAAANALMDEQRSFFLLAWLYACVEWLRRLLDTLTGSRKRKGSKKAAKPPAPATAAAAAPAAAASKAQPAAAKPQQATQSKAAATASMSSTPAAPAAAAPPSPQRPAASKAPPPVPSAPTPAAATAPKPVAAAAAPAAQAKAAPLQAAQAAAKPEPASIKVSPAWAPGTFQLHEAPGAHADVVSSVALVGEHFITTGYDSDVQIWSWPKGGVPRVVKHLAGHSGRVEAVCASLTAQQAVTSGRDSSLRLWDLSEGPAAAKEVRNTYVYESVRSLEVDWGSGAAYLGCKSGAICVWDLKAGRRLAVLRGHEEEVTALRLVPAKGTGQGAVLFSGCREGQVAVWRVPAGRPKQEQLWQVAAGRLAKGRVAALAVAGGLLYVGDFSSSVKVCDVSELLAGTGTQDPGQQLQQLQQLRRVPNADAFAGAECPVAGLSVAPAAGVLVSSAVSWLEPSNEELREAAEDAEQPLGCLHVHTLQEHPEKYVYTIRLGACNVVTCLQHDGAGRIVAGAADGSVLVLQLAGKGAGAAGEGWDAVKGLPIGVEELSEESEDEDEDDSDGREASDDDDDS